MAMSWDVLLCDAVITEGEDHLGSHHHGVNRLQWYFAIMLRLWSMEIDKVVSQTERGTLM